MVSKTNNLSGHMSNLLIDWYYSVLSEVVHWDILWESKTDKVYINKCSDLHFIEYSQEENNTSMVQSFQKEQHFFNRKRSYLKWRSFKLKKFQYPHWKT